MVTYLPGCKSADKNEASALLPHSRTEDKCREGVTSVKPNRWTQWDKLKGNMADKKEKDAINVNNI